jgi:hypothetical protein
VTDRFQDGRRRHVGNSSDCYKMSNYHLIATKIGRKTKKNMSSSKITKAVVQAKFQDGRRRHFRNSSGCYKMGNYHSILTEISTQTKKNMLGSKITIPEVEAKFQDACRCYLQDNGQVPRWPPPAFWKFK